jgi:hypothetical protein
MPRWEVTVIDKADPGRMEQTTHLVDDYTDEAQVRAFAEQYWQHLEYVSARWLDKPEPVPAVMELSTQEAAQFQSIDLGASALPAVPDGLHVFLSEPTEQGK